MRGKRVLWVIGGLAMVALVIGLVSAVVMMLWNAMLPSLFGLRVIGFWEALGLLVLARILFGGFRGRGGWHWGWRHRMHERWARMTPEEREKFREGMRAHCGRWHSVEEPRSPA